MKKKGRKRGERANVTLRLPEDSLQALAETAEQMGISRNGLISMVLNRMADLARIDRLQQMLVDFYNDDEIALALHEKSQEEKK